MIKNSEKPAKPPSHLVDFVACAAFIAFVVSFFFVPELRTKLFWAGDKGLLEVVAPIGTVAAASVAAWLAWRNYLLGQRKEMSDRFERGVMLLGSEGEAKRTAGVIVLEDLALSEAAGQHVKWIREYLPIAVAEWNQSLRASISYPLSSRIYDPTPSAIIRALHAIARIPKHTDQALVIPSLYLSQSTLSEVTLQHMICHQAIVFDSYFQLSDLDRLILSGIYFGSLDVNDCSLRRARIQIQSGSSVDVYIDQSDISDCRITAVAGTEVVLSNCKVDGLSIGGEGDFKLENCWFENTPPVIKSTKAIEAEPTVYKAKANGSTPSGRATWKAGEEVPVPVSMIAPRHILRRVRG